MQRWDWPSLMHADVRFVQAAQAALLKAAGAQQLAFERIVYDTMAAQAAADAHAKVGSSTCMCWVTVWSTYVACVAITSIGRACRMHA
jgi:hypothetical protein